MNEKYRFGKRYVQLEDGTWKYLADTMAEAEYRDKISEGVSTFKTYAFGIAWIAAAIALYIYKPEVFEKISNSPIVIGLAIGLGIVAAVIIVLLFVIPLITIMPELVRAYKRDILGIDPENEEEYSHDIR